MTRDADSDPEVDVRYNTKVREQLADFDPEMLLADGFDDCIIGTCYTPGPGNRVVYDADLIIKTLIEQDGMSLGEAWEYFEFNIEGGYHGEKTPIFLRHFEE